MSLFAELKRRKVFKVAAAYAVVGWLVIEVAATIAPQLNFPEWVPRLITFILLLGFPVALVMAWMFDVTPEGIKVDASRAGSKRIYAAAAVLAALALAWYFHGGASQDAAASDRSIAVLPFVNMSGNPDQDYFSDGMTEELLNVLAKFPELQVVARTSVFQFKDKGGDIRDIGAKLGVSHILEGSVRRDGDEVRVTAQLIRVSDGFHVWSETYDRKLESVFALQDEIAQRVGAQLASSLATSAPTESRGDVDPVAYDEYLKGRALHRARTNVLTAIFHFQNAVDRQPDFAAAWASLSLSYEVSFYQTNAIEKLALGDRLDHMRDAAKHAQALAPDAAPTLHALANVARGEGQFLEAEKLYERSMAVDPGYADVREDYIEFLAAMGRIDDGLKLAQDLVQREPSVGIFWWRVADCGIDLDRKDVVDEASRQMLELDQDSGNGLLAPFLLEISNGRIDSARELITALREQHPEQVAEDWVAFQWALKDPAIDEATVQQWLLDRSFSFLPQIALRGDYDFYFASISQADGADKRFYNYVNMQMPVARRYLPDPRAKQILRDSGFEKYWRVKGWPRYCRAKGDNDFECGDFAAKGNK